MRFVPTVDALAARIAPSTLVPITITLTSDAVITGVSDIVDLSSVVTPPDGVVVDVTPSVPNPPFPPPVLPTPVPPGAPLPTPLPTPTPDPILPTWPSPLPEGGPA